MGVNYVHNALYVAASFSSAVLILKFFIPFFNFNDNFIDKPPQEQLQSFWDNKISLS